MLPLPAEVSVPPFRHVVLNWNPKGHIPPHVYDVPHFDFHFYILTPEERAKVSIAGAGMALVQQKPPERYLPPGYIAAPGGEESGMGAHWVDLASHEFHGNPFTHAFIYGTYAGRIAFLEPMVANTFLEKKQNVDLPIAQPPAVQVKGYYPTRYFVRYDPARKEYQVGMDGMRLREATP